MLLGCGYSFLLIRSNANKYYSYPSFMKEESEKNYRTDFPKVTICLNSMHSLKKLYDEYPEFVQIQKKMNNVTQIQTPILSAFYGQNGIPRGTNMTWLRELDTDEFLRRTYSDVKIVGCQFGSISCVNKWALKKTLYGYCMEGSPSKFGNETEKKETENAMSISILLTYNLDNWSPGGWAHYLEGTVFY